jgi:hypothetical protein
MATVALPGGVRRIEDFDRQVRVVKNPFARAA